MKTYGFFSACVAWQIASFCSAGDSLGDSLGESDGDSLGLSLGDSDGDSLGLSLGDSLGLSLGDSLGLSLGDSDGDSLGDSEGDSSGDSPGPVTTSTWLMPLQSLDSVRVTVTVSVPMPAMVKQPFPAVPSAVMRSLCLLSGPNASSPDLMQTPVTTWPSGAVNVTASSLCPGSSASALKLVLQTAELSSPSASAGVAIVNNDTTRPSIARMAKSVRPARRSEVL